MRKNNFSIIVKLALVFSLITGAQFSFGADKAENPANKEKSPKKEKIAPRFVETKVPVEADDFSPLHGHSFGIGIGETFLNGGFSDHGENLITFDFIYTYTASYSFDLMINAHYSKHEIKNEQALVQGAAIGIKGKFYQFDSFSPFCLGGFGFYRPKVIRPVDGRLIESEAKTTFGIHVGVGADLKLNNSLSVGMLAHYHNPFDVKQNIGPEVEGSYFKLLMTVMYTI